MKFSVDRKAFAAAAETASKAAAGRVALPVLMSLHVEALDGIVAVTGTDLTTGRRVEIEADVETPGRSVVPKTLAKAVAASNGDTVTCELGEALAVSVGGSDFTFDVIDPDEYPNEPNVIGDSIPIEGWERIRSVATVASTDERPLLQGVCFRNGWAMATDSYRLARTKVAESPEIIIPARSIAELRESPSQIVTDGRTVKATLDNGAWWSQLIESNGYPKGESMIEASKAKVSCRATVDTDQLLDAIGRARLVVDDDIPMRCDFGSGGIAVTVTRSGRKRFTEFVPAKVDGDLEGVHLSMPYLKSLLAPVETAEIEMIDPHKAIWITANWWEALMMPVRT